MSGLSFSLLGPLEASFEGQSLLPFPTLKVQALLSILLAERVFSPGAPMRRETLTNRLWPGMPEDSARKNLRQALYLLRQAIPTAPGSDGDVPFVLGDYQRLEIHPHARYDLDLASFIELTATSEPQALAEAVKLYRGDFLHDFYLDDSNEFEEWAAGRRAALHLQALNALHILANHHLAQGQFELAESYAHRQVLLEPLHEEGHSQLIEALARSGRRSAALEAYETFRQQLQQELHLAPSEQLQQLVLQVRSGQVQAAGGRSRARGYDLKEQIGQGSFGTVYRAIQPAIGREVAIKTIRRRFANNPDFIRRFEAEAQLVARLEHPHIVPLYDYWREPGEAYLVMRWMRGGSLKDALAQGPWSLEKAAQLVGEVASALDAAHQQSIVHLDIKPGNILLDEAGRGYLTDFGIARLLDSGGSTGTATRHGSYYYMAPEQLAGQELSPQTDIYSLGLVMYELLAGHRPYGDTPTGLLMVKRLSEPLPPLGELRPDLPAGVATVIEQATSRQPGERFTTAFTLAEAFHQAVFEKAVDPPRLIALRREVPNPYQGLRPFGEAEAGRFFGREALVAQLVEGLRQSRFLVVVGPSGSGKSSVVRAGLLPALRSGALPGSANWFIVDMLPGPHPFEELEAALLRVAVNPPASLLAQLQEDQRGLVRAARRVLPERDGTLLVLVDQFEELYTLVDEEDERRRFLDLLLASVQDEHSPILLVLTLRADFYDRPLNSQTFGELVRDNQVSVVPPNTQELARAICLPAEGVGVEVDEALLTALVQDVYDRPGTLPLLQYALTELFDRRQQQHMSLVDYQHIGGVSGSLANRAEALYQELDEGQQALVKQVFLRLVAVGDGAEDTRRRVLLSELETLLMRASSGDGSEPGAAGTLSHILDQYGRHRLLTFDRDPITRSSTVEIAHEALLNAWPRFNAWVETSREDLRQERRLMTLAQEWQDCEQDPELLLRGSQLEHMSDFAFQTHLALTEEERAFLEASWKARQDREAAEVQRVEAERKLERRSRSFLRLLVGVFAVAAIAALLLSNYAFGQRDLFSAESQARATAQAELNQERLDAEEQERIARSRELASLAQLKLLDDPELGMLLALEGLRTSRTTEAENALRLSLHSTRLERTLYGHGWRIYWLRVSPDGRTLASSSGVFYGGSRVWDITSGRQLFTLPGEDITFQMGGEQLVTLALDENNIRIIQQNWSLATGELVKQSVVPGVQWGEKQPRFYFNNELTRAIFGYADGHVELWNTLTGELLLSWQAHDVSIRDMAFSPDNRWLATITEAELKVWDGQTGLELFPITTFSCCGPGSTTAVFSPDGRLLAASGETSNEAIIWDVEASIQAGEGQALSTLRGHTAIINTYAFSADGTRLATGGDDGTAIVWSLDDGQLLFTLSGHDRRVSAVAFTPDGLHLISADAAGDIRIWDLSPSGTREVSTLAATPFMDLDYSPDGSRFAAVGTDGRLRIWSAATEAVLLDIQAHEGFAFEVDFSLDGRHIATTGSDNQVVVWDAGSGTELFSIRGHAEGVYAGFWPNYQSVAYSPDGQSLATGGADGMVKLWDAASGAEIALTHPMSLTHGGSPAPVAYLAFSPDGRYLAAAGDGDKALVYDIRSGKLVLVADTDPARMTALSFSPDGSKLTVGHWGGDLRVIDFPASLAGGEPVELFTIYSDQVVFKAAFSPDGRYLAAARQDHVARVYDSATGEPLFDLTGMSNFVLDAQFSPDGRVIRVASFDGSLRTYVASTEDLIDLAYSRLTRWWRSEECSQYLHPAECPVPERAIIRVDNATSVAELIGTWRTESVQADIYLRFLEDGRLILAQTLEDLDDAPLFEATYEMDGEILSVKDPECAEQDAQNRLRLVREPGQPLRLILDGVLIPCAGRLKLNGTSYVPVEP